MSICSTRRATTRSTAAREDSGARRRCSATRAAAGDEATNPTNVDGSKKAEICDKDYEKQVVLIVGKGRVGKALDKMAASLGYFHGFIVRDDVFTPSAQRDGPIYVATHASDIDGALAAIHSNRKNDLVLLQGGLLRRAWLVERGLAEATQVALYASAGEDGAIKDGGGSTVVTGPYAKHVVGMLLAGGVASSDVNARAFDRASLQKLLWASIFWLLCDVHGGTVGEIVEDPAGEDRVRGLANELIDVAVAAGEISAADEEQEDGCWKETMVEGLLAYSRAITASTPSRQTAVKEGAFRNGWFLAVGGVAAQPLHVDLLTRAGIDVDALTVAGREEHCA